MTKDEMMEMAGLLKKYLETGVVEQMQEAWAKGDYVKSSALSQARQSAYSLLQIIEKE